MNTAQHWQKVYTTKAVNQVGWYRPHLDTSLALIKELPLPKNAAIIDVGGGASTLVDDLLQEGFQNITVLDIAPAAIETAKQRLKEKSLQVRWLVADVLSVSLPEHYYHLWHDRAVLHFFTEKSQQQRYLSQLKRALKIGGYCIIGVFSLEAPPKCSGLPVQRYSIETLQTLLGKDFSLIRSATEDHYTPSGTYQPYVYGCFIYQPT